MCLELARVYNQPNTMRERGYSRMYTRASERVYIQNLVRISITWRPDAQGWLEIANADQTCLRRKGI